MAQRLKPHRDELNNRFPVFVPEETPDPRALAAVIYLLLHRKRRDRNEILLVVIMAISAMQREVTLRQVAEWLRRWTGDSLTAAEELERLVSKEA